jgi:hypothetical protein
MTIYFAFSDEQGSYKVRPKDKFLKAHPYYLRSTILIYAREWKFLTQEMANLRKKYLFPGYEEIKWSYIWSLRKCIKQHKEIDKSKNYYFLRDTKPEDIEAYVSDVISLLPKLEYCKVIYTVTENTSNEHCKESTILSFHIQDLMQRIEMELSNDDENLAVLFIDALSEKTDKNLREAYSKIYKRGDFIRDYAHIKDSLNLEYSHQSAGIQVADYLAGAFFSLLTDRPLGKKLFRDYIFDCLRKEDKSGKLMGYGVVEVPKSHLLRESLRKQILEKINVDI